MSKTLKCLVMAISVGILLMMSACSNKTHGLTEKTDLSTEAITTATSTPTLTPIPTYAPGIELYGMLSVTGEVVIKPKYEYLDIFSEEGLARFEDHGIWGFVNEQGEEAIPAQYEDAKNFSEGLAAVKVDGLYGFIDVSGQMVIEPHLENIQDGFMNGRCVFQEGSKKGLINTGGQIILEPVYSSINLYSLKYFIVSDGAQHGLIDTDGKVIVDLQPNEIYAVTDSGFYFTRKSSDNEYDMAYDIFERYPPQYTAEYQSEYLRYPIASNSLIKVSLDGEKWGLLNPEDGTLSVDYLYDYIKYSRDKQYAEVYYGTRTGTLDLMSGNLSIYGENEWTFWEYFGHILYEKQDMIGVNRIDGTEVLPAEYERIICTPHKEYAVLRPGESSYKVINEQGDILYAFEAGTEPIRFIPSIDCWECFFQSYSESDGIMDSDGFISRDGTKKVELQCYEYHASPFWFGADENLMTTPAIYSVVLADGYGGFGILNPLENPVPEIYEDYSWFPDQKVLVVTDRAGNSGLVSYDGTVLFELQDCHIFTNTGLTIDRNDPYVYDTYNDTDYLLYTVATK